MAIDLKLNYWALILTVVKRGHPDVSYEDDPAIFEGENPSAKYEEIEKDYFSPEEIIKALKIICKKF